jgi:hypothetical protein
MPYTPLDSQSLFSTAFLEGAVPWAVWTAILASTDQDGNTALWPGHLARVWNMPVEEVEAAWNKHSSPDPASKSVEHEGRRIIKLADGRWHVVNHLRYREKYSKEKRAEALRDAKRRQRAKEKGENVECEKCHAWVANPGDKICPKCAFGGEE